MSDESVGSLLATIAHSVNDALRIMMFADKRAWGPDEFEQLRLLEEALDEAKKDFQELPALITGQFYYENDRTNDSLEDLRTLCTRFELHSQNFKDWVKAGGPINPLWAHDTILLRRQLHRAQCRAARRIYHSEKESATRCLGAHQVYRVQRSPESPQQRNLEELVACSKVGRFERFGETDIAFTCDFCDGYIVWEDLRDMPSSRAVPGGVAPASATSTAPATQDHWQARGITRTTREDKHVVFAPVAIANHIPPGPGEWQARILCPFCDDYYAIEQGDGEVDQVKYAQDENGFEDLNAFREHLEWWHTSIAQQRSECNVM